MLEGTILACATAPGVSARGVLRLSGPAAIASLRSLAVNPAVLDGCPGFGSVALALDVDGARLDVWATVYRAPRSYTREDVVEVQLPSSLPLMGMLARALVIRDGVRWAGPGEFTLRAFRNGRIDLAQAEAVAQVISATEEAELRAARRGLSGELGAVVRAVADRLTGTLALMEACIDFADEDIPEFSGGRLSGEVGEIVAAVDRLKRSTSLRLAGEGSFHCVLAGLPNAGKSSLLNALLGRREALVSELAGTTRDPVRGTTREGTLSVTWVDLAGGYPRPGERLVSGLDRRMNPETRAAVERLTSLELEHADGVLWLVDAAGEYPESLEAFESLEAVVKLLVFNKVDLLDAPARASLAGRYPAALLTSALDGTGLDELRAAVGKCPAAASRQGSLAGEPARFLVSSHQEAALQLSREALDRALDVLDSGAGLELAAADLRDALRSLEDLIGEVTPDDVLDRVFAGFCVGK